MIPWVRVKKFSPKKRYDFQVSAILFFYKKYNFGNNLQT